jgi:hypothetical protein
MEDIVKKPVHDGMGPDCFFIVEWNRDTQKMFDKGKRPRGGLRYVLECDHFDGKRAYFVIRQM